MNSFSISAQVEFCTSCKDYPHSYGTFGLPVNFP